MKKSRPKKNKLRKIISNNTSRFIINRAGIIVLSHTQVCSRYNFFYTIHFFKSNRRKKNKVKQYFFVFCPN